MEKKKKKKKNLVMKGTHEDVVHFKDVTGFTDHFSCVYLTILVMVENGDCSGGGRSDDPVWVQKLPK